MARKRIRWERTDTGLYVPGDTDTIPDGALKRNRGLDATPTGTWRSRNGSTTLYELNAHSLYRFGDVRFQGAGTVLYRNGISIITGLNGQRLSFVRMPPTAGKVDYLFVAGGGLPRKIDSSGNVTQWGITKPTYGSFAAGLGTQLTKVIDAFDDESTWTESGCTLANEGTIKQEGTNSMSVSVAGANSRGTVAKSITVNLAQFASGPTTSPNEDYIEVWVRIEQPWNLELLRIEFSLGNTTFATETYSRSIVPNTDIPLSQEISKQAVGVEEAVKIERMIETSQGTVIEDPETGELVFLDQWEQLTGLENMGQTTVTGTPGQWTKLRLPKSTFQRSGDSADDWDDVQAVRITVATNAGGGCQVYWDDMKLAGSAGLMGRYRYHLTYKNSVTGSRSVAGTTYVEIENVERQPVALSNIPASADPQVDTVEIWRTVGGGTRFFKIAEQSDAISTYTDRIPDFAWMDSTATTFMSSEELPNDDDPPLGGAWDIWGPHAGRMWHAREQTTGSKGRVYWSPVGRPEAIEDFLDVGTEDNPIVKGIAWNGQNFVFSEAKVFRILGTTTPFTALEVFGIPGTIDPFSVVATPYGIIYEAVDGVRVFDGNTSKLLSPNAVQVLFLGEAHENLAAMGSPTVAEYHKDQYFISDATQTLACDLARAVWRDLGKGCNALYHEPDTGKLIATVGGSVVDLEAEGVYTEISSNVPFDLKTWAYQQDKPFVLERLTVNADTSDQALELTYHLDTTSVTSTMTATSSRALRSTTAYRMCDRLAVQLAATSLAAQVEIFNIEAMIRDFVLDVRGPGGGFQIPAQITSATSVIFEIDGADDPQQLDQLWLVRRLVFDHETNSQNVTPTLELNSASIALPFYEGVRQPFTYDINRVGLLRSVLLTASSSIYNLEVYRTWLEVEPVQLVIRVHTNGPIQRIVVPGRFNEDFTEVVFEIDPTEPVMSREATPLLRRLFVDFESLETITPVIEQHGAIITLGPYAAPSRTLQPWEINQAGRLIKLRLQADWSQAIDLRAVELDVMLPEGI